MGGTSFFTRFSAERIWKGVTGVSSAGRKRGRGSGSSRKLVLDFNKGQKFGEGPRRIKIPFINTQIQPKTSIKPEIIGHDPEFNRSLYGAREKQTGFPKRAINPLDRGWSGMRLPGMKIGPPEEVAGIKFVGFQSIVLLARPLFKMTGVHGRTKRVGALVVTGNGNGLGGFADATGTDMRGAISQARNRAGQALIRVKLWENHTVMHDFFSKYYHTTVFVERKPPGYGIKAHRVIKAICDVMGIKDLHAKVEGGSKAIGNVHNITKAFFLGLMKQKSYNEIADEKRLHLVELREEHYNYPKILASPSEDIGVRSESNIKSGEILDFTYYINEGRIRQVKPPAKNFFLGTEAWQRHLNYQDYVKNRDKTKLEFAARYEDKSVFDVFPEFKSVAFKKSESSEDQESQEKSQESV